MKLLKRNPLTGQDEVQFEINTQFFVSFFLAVCCFVIYTVTRQITRANLKLELAESANKKLTEDVLLLKTSIENLSNNLNTVHLKMAKINSIAEATQLSADITIKAQELAYKASIAGSTMPAINIHTNGGNSTIYNLLLLSFGCACIGGIVYYFGVPILSAGVVKVNEALGALVTQLLVGNSTLKESYRYVADNKLTFKAIIDPVTKQMELFVSPVVNETDLSKITTPCRIFFGDHPHSFNSECGPSQKIVVESYRGVSEMIYQKLSNVASSPEALDVVVKMSDSIGGGSGPV